MEIKLHKEYFKKQIFAGLWDLEKFLFPLGFPAPSPTNFLVVNHNRGKYQVIKHHMKKKKNGYPQEFIFHNSEKTGYVVSALLGFVCLRPQGFAWLVLLHLARISRWLYSLHWRELSWAHTWCNFQPCWLHAQELRSSGTRGRSEP